MTTFGEQMKTFYTNEAEKKLVHFFFLFFENTLYWRNFWVLEAKKRKNEENLNISLAQRCAPLVVEALRSLNTQVPFLLTDGRTIDGRTVIARCRGACPRLKRGEI